MTKKLSVLVLILSVLFFAAGCDLLGTSEKTSYEINATSTIGGSVTGAGVYEKGATVSLVATAETGYVFKGWYVGENIVNTNRIYNVVSNANKTYEAKFLANYSDYTLTYQVKTDDYLVDLGGSVVLETSYTDNLADLTRRKTVALNATASDGYEFVGWKKGNTIVSVENRISVTLLANETYVAHFESTVQSATLTGKYVSLLMSGEVLIYEFHNDNTATIQNYVNVMSEKTVSYAIINNNLVLFDTQTTTYSLTMQGNNFSYVNNDSTYAFKKVANQVAFEKDYYYVENNTTLKAFSFELNNSGAYVLQTNSVSEPVVQEFDYYVYNNKLIILGANFKQIFNYAVAGNSLAIFNETESIVAYELKENIEETYYVVRDDSYYALDFEPTGNLVHNFKKYSENAIENTTVGEKYYLLQNQIIRLSETGLSASNISFTQTSVTLQIDGVATAFEKLTSSGAYENKQYYYEDNDISYLLDLKSTGELSYYSSESDEMVDGYYFIKNNNVIVLVENNAVMFNYNELIATNTLTDFIEGTYVDATEDEDYTAVSIVEFTLNGEIFITAYQQGEEFATTNFTVSYFIVGDKIITIGYDNYSESYFIDVAQFTVTPTTLIIDNQEFDALAPYIEGTYVGVFEDEDYTSVSIFEFTLNGEIIITGYGQGEESSTANFTVTYFIAGNRIITIGYDDYLESSFVDVSEITITPNTLYINNQEFYVLAPYIEGIYVDVAEDENYTIVTVFEFTSNGEFSANVYQQGEEFGAMTIAGTYFITGDKLVIIYYENNFQSYVITSTQITVTPTTLIIDQIEYEPIKPYIDATYRYSEGEEYIEYNFDLDGTMTIHSSFANDSTSSTYYLVNNQLILIIDSIDFNTVEFVDDMLIVTNVSNQSATLYLVA